jgi:hypothetical protein
MSRLCGVHIIGGGRVESVQNESLTWGIWCVATQDTHDYSMTGAIKQGANNMVNDESQTLHEQETGRKAHFNNELCMIRVL